MYTNLSFTNLLVVVCLLFCVSYSCQSDSQCGYNYYCDNTGICDSDWPDAVTYVLGLLSIILICFGGGVARHSHFGPPDSGFQYLILCLAVSLTAIGIVELIWCPGGLTWGIIACFFALLFWIQFVNLCIHFRRYPMHRGGAGGGPPHNGPYGLRQGGPGPAQGQAQGQGGYGYGYGYGYNDQYDHPPPPPPPPLFCCWWCDRRPYYQPVGANDPNYYNNNNNNNNGGNAGFMSNDQNLETGGNVGNNNNTTNPATMENDRL